MFLGTLKNALRQTMKHKQSAAQMTAGKFDRVLTPIAGYVRNIYTRRTIRGLARLHGERPVYIASNQTEQFASVVWRLRSCL